MVVVCFPGGGRLAAASTMMGPHLAQPSPHREKKQETANWFWGVRRIGGGGGGGGSGHGRVATEGLVSRPAPVAWKAPFRLPCLHLEEVFIDNKD